MKRYVVRVLRKGDQVLNVLPGQIIVRRKNGEVDILTFIIDASGVPRLDRDRLITVSYGNDVVEFVNSPEVPVGKAKKRSRRMDSKPGVLVERSKTGPGANDEVIAGSF